MRIATIRTGLVSLMVSSAGLTASAQTWLNETDAASECDHCILVFPTTTVADPFGGLIFGRIFEAGVTPIGHATAGVLAQLGVGPAGSDPRTTPGWTWTDATYNVQVGNEDEYQAQLTGTHVGLQSYTFRFSLDGGQSFTLADLDGAGSNPGLHFDVSQLGTAIVQSTAPVPEPASVSLLLAGLVVARALARRCPQHG